MRLKRWKGQRRRIERAPGPRGRGGAGLSLRGFWVSDGLRFGIFVIMVSDPPGLIHLDYRIRRTRAAVSLKFPKL